MSKKSMTLSTLNEQILFEPKAYKKTAHPRNSEEGQGWEETEVSDTLNTFDQTEKRASTILVDAPIIAIEGNGCRPSHSGSGFSEDGVSYTLNSVELHGVYDGYRVRRLTPKECARLQGFPDDWCDGIKHGDSAEYKMWGNGMALPCALYVMEGVKDYLERNNFDAEEV